MTDAILGFEDTYSILLDVVSVVDVDGKECVDDSLVNILILCLVEILNSIFVNILKVKFSQDFEANLPSKL